MQSWNEFITKLLLIEQKRGNISQFLSLFGREQKL
nr:MAG TPA: hypothetical protein [Caudoviricetes sp.]